MRDCWSGFRAKPAIPHPTSAAETPSTAKIEPEIETSSEKAARKSARDTTMALMSLPYSTWSAP
jgi:hypothetical protein